MLQGLYMPYTSSHKKTFSNETDFYTELYFYKEFKDFPYIPKLLSVEKNTLVLQKIIGSSLYDIDYNQQLLVAKTLSEFHKFTNYKLIHKDTNLNNYIFSENMVYMVDFSDVTMGNHLSDIYSILLFFAELHSIDIFPSFVDNFLNISSIKKHDMIILYNEILGFENRRHLYKKNIHGSYQHNKKVLVDIISRFN